MERVVKFEVLGQEYQLSTDASDEDVHEILQLVKNLLESYSQSASSLPANKLAILASLNMAGKYVKLRREFDEFKLMVGQTADMMESKIDSVLELK